MPRGLPWMVLLALATAAPPVTGQTRTCRPELVRAGTGVRRALGPGRVHQFLGGGVLFRCIGRSDTLIADSVAWYSELDRMDFVGHVQLRDSTMHMAAERARYFPGDERIEASQDVRVENRVTGSVLTGPVVTYWRAARGVRDTTEMFASRRPHVDYRTTADTAEAPYRIVAEQIRMKGDDRAWASGGVEIEREDFTATADSAALDLGSGEGYLVHRAVATGGTEGAFRIEGNDIAFRLEDDMLRWVQARRNAHAVSEDWAVTGDTVEFLLEDDLIQEGAVWGDSARALAVSDEHRITADSLAFDSPGQVLSEVRGFRSAKAASAVDSLPDDPDWVAGDTLRARFEEWPSGGRGLAELEAWGNARAYYHIFDEEDPSLVPAINYALAARVRVRLREDGVDRVEFVDQAHGVYAEPAARPRP